MDIDPPIGVIGAGAIGSRMARRLLTAGRTVVVHDIDRAAMSRAASQGAALADTPAAMAARCPVIITCVTDDAAVERVVFGPDGIVDGATTETTVIETTTSTPTATRRCADALGAIGARLIDAPVSRGVPAAENGTLSIMVGGDPATIDRCLPVLERLGTDIIRTGPLGTGHIAKAMNMMILGVNLLAAAEVVGLGERLGFPAAEMIARLNDGPAESFMTTNHFPRYVLSGRFDSSFTLGLMLKDMRVATRIAHEHGVPVLFGSRVEEIYALAAAQGRPDRDNTLIVPFLHGLMPPAMATTAPDPAIGKALVTLLTATTLLGTLEACLAGARAGLDPAALMAAVNASSGRSHVSANVVPPQALSGRFGWGVTVDDLDRSCAAAIAAARSRNLPLLVTTLTLDLLAVARGRGLGDADGSRLLPLLDHMVGRPPSLRA